MRLRSLDTFALVFVFAAAVHVAAGQVPTKPASPAAPGYTKTREVMNAIRVGDIEKTKALLDQETSLIQTKDMTGGTVLHQVSKMRVMARPGAGEPITTESLRKQLFEHQKAMAELLLSKGAGINAQDDNGETPLAAAAARGHKELAEFLVSKGADANIANAKGEKPLDKATAINRPDLVQFLTAHTAAPKPPPSPPAAPPQDGGAETKPAPEPPPPDQAKEPKAEPQPEAAKAEPGPGPNVEPEQKPVEPSPNAATEPHAEQPAPEPGPDGQSAAEQPNETPDQPSDEGEPIKDQPPDTQSGDEPPSAEPIAP